MTRIRTVKPDLFRHEELFDAEQESGLPLRLAFIGLFTECDREGRFAWRPRALGTAVLPYDQIDFSRVLDALATRGFVRKYTVAGKEYGVIPSWHRHQVINNREAQSEIPEHIDDAYEKDASGTREARVVDVTLQLPRGREGKGKEGKGITEANASSAPAPSELPSLDPSRMLFGDGLQVLASISGRPAQSLRSQVGKWVRLTGNDPGAVLRLIQHAKERAIIEPVAWIEASLKPKDPDAEIYRGVI